MRTLDRRKFLTVSAGVGLADATWPWDQDALGGTHPQGFNRGQFTGEAVSRTRRTFYVRSPNDPRSRLMKSLGFVVPEQIAQLAADQDAFTISREQFDIDVLVWNVLSLPYAVEATVPKLADAAAKPA
ncbi:ABC transporter substrate-binding protein [Rhodococcus sp. WB9]|uniref:ABC transporter substrate-binding protein n=1 Tax=Rhodococcus sp. WB9 TaxID=2594007 RepID=UPI001186807B|nr:ABC transporter substrate-binding protein [Rhodococcus sp. WB9]QDQ89924.1 ABC transporter substrate-binding protein [Rhodococcus sp. WB9]